MNASASRIARTLLLAALARMQSSTFPVGLRWVHMHCLSALPAHP